VEAELANTGYRVGVSLSKNRFIISPIGLTVGVALKNGNILIIFLSIVCLLTYGHM
jgi:hypothetical protein